MKAIIFSITGVLLSVAALILCVISTHQKEPVNKSPYEKYGCLIYPDRLSRDTCSMKKEGFIFDKRGDTLYYSVDHLHYAKY